MEGLLPRRKRRKDADEPQWTPRDDYLIWFIGQMRALRYDQVQRLLARLSEYQIDNGMLSFSQTSRIIGRWVKKKYAVYRRVYVGQPGWIHLTARGLHHAGLDFRAEEPINRMLEHIFWITEVRLKIEEENPAIRWISEREIAAQQEQRRKDQRLNRTPDAILITESEEIDIEVQISRPAVLATWDICSEIGILDAIEHVCLPKHVRREYNQQRPFCSYSSSQAPIFTKERFNSWVVYSL